MDKDQALAVFEHFKIRRVYDEETDAWYFSVVDIIAALIQQPDYQTARKYWNKLKERLRKEESESVTNCHRLKLEAAFHPADRRERRSDRYDGKCRCGEERWENCQENASRTGAKNRQESGFWRKLLAADHCAEEIERKNR